MPRNVRSIFSALTLCPPVNDNNTKGCNDRVVISDLTVLKATLSSEATLVARYIAELEELAVNDNREEENE